MTVQSDIQPFNPGDLIDLFILDTSKYDSSLHHFTPSVETQSIWFNNNEYQPLPMQATGFSKNSSGTIPQPKLSIADVSGSIHAMTRQYNDLIGSKITRIRTFTKYLDVISGGDGSFAKFPDEVYFIQRKSSQNKFLVEFTLSSSFDLQGMRFPKRIVLKNICTHTYRTWVGPGNDDFSYVNTTCPYTDAAYFKSNGDSTTSGEVDVCGKKYSDCVLRFPAPLALPTRAFPGVSNVRR